MPLNSTHALHDLVALVTRDEVDVVGIVHGTVAELVLHGYQVGTCLATQTVNKQLR